MKILLHTCCAPCTVYPLGVLRERGHEVSGYFYNPNIHPYAEFEKRKETLVAFARGASLPLEVDEAYELDAFLRGALGAGDRCLFCYRMRLEQAFRHAGERGLHAVTTTLLYSKYQRHAAITTIASELSETYGVPFLYEDFRIGWQEGVETAKRLGLYRQNYCGCLFSERERHRPPR